MYNNIKCCNILIVDLHCHCAAEDFKSILNRSKPADFIPFSTSLASLNPCLYRPQKRQSWSWPQNSYWSWTSLGFPELAKLKWFVCGWLRSSSAFFGLITGIGIRGRCWPGRPKREVISTVRSQQKHRTPLLRGFQKCRILHNTGPTGLYEHRL